MANKRASSDHFRTIPNGKNELREQLLLAKGRLIELEKGQARDHLFIRALVEVCEPTTEQIVEAAKRASLSPDIGDVR